ncbi:MAG TPA: CHRD domain-containing protein [Myxococcales bacterium]|jgi:CHRD domain-containing protein|nr:CHRD domain-containing protein [Myxococcales bacterium]
MTSLRLAFALLAVSLLARADEGNRFRAHLVGTEETPAIFTAGSGTFTARVLGNDTRIEFTLTYENLTAPPLVAHVHFGQRNVAGGVSFFFCGGGGKPPCPASPSGTITGTVVAADVVGPTAQGIQPGDLAAILAMIRAGFGYANMHTPLHPGGEIRGQIKSTGGGD